MTHSIPYISIITATYNSAVTIQECINSVYEQSCSHIVEHIIIDGSSTDHTVAIIEKNSKKIACWVSEPDTGIYDAFNKGIKLAKGKWVLFLGSDDMISSNNVIKNCLPVLNKHEKDCALIYGNLYFLYEDNTQVKISRPWSEISHTFTIARPSLPIHCETFHNVSMIFEQDIIFDTNYKIAADSKLMLETIKLNGDPKYIDTDITIMRSGGKSASYGNIREVFNECRSISSELDIYIPLRCKVINYMQLHFKYILYLCLDDRTIYKIRSISRNLLRIMAR